MESSRNIEEKQLRVCKILRTTNTIPFLLVETTAKKKQQTITVFAGVR